MSLQVKYSLTIDGNAASTDLLNAVKHIEYEDHAVMADMLRLRVATAVKTDGGELSILFLQAGGELTAKLAPDGQSLVGSWKQGGVLPITLTKQSATGK